MQVFKAFLKTAYKFLPTISLYFIIFTALAVMLAYSVTESPTASFESVELRVGIIDNDESDASKAMEEYLDSLHELIYLKSSQDTILDCLYYRNVEYILVIPEGFEENLLAGKDKGLFETVQIPGIYNSAFVDEQITSYLKTVKLYLAGDYALDEALSKTADALTDTVGAVEIADFGTEDETSSTMTMLLFFFQFIPYVLASMILSGLTPILTIFWEKNLAKRISCASTSLTSRNVQLALGSVLYALFSWGLFILTASIIYGSETFSEKGLLCILNSLFLLPLSVAISLVISAFTPSANVTNMLNNIICLGMSFLCGIFIPQSQLGEGVLSVSKFLPFYWYIKNNDLISGFGGEKFDMTVFWQNCGVQMLYIVALFAIALVVTKYKNSKQKA